MGHQRLGILPATKAWREIVAYIANGNVSVGALTGFVLDACDKSFEVASDDPAFKEALYLLCKIPMAAKAENLQVSLKELGIDVPSNPTRTDIVVGFDQAIEKIQHSNTKGITDLSELAKNAGAAVLNTLLAKPPPPPQLELWGEAKSGTHMILREAATPDGFCDLAQSFFATFGKNNIEYFVSRELPRHLGQSGFCQSIPDMLLFEQNNTQHNNEASMIMRTFAREWYAKANYHEKKKLSQKDVAGFASVAITKMRKEYRMRNTHNGTA